MERGVNRLWNAAKNFARDEEGAALVEYTTLLAVVLGGAIAVLGGLGLTVSNILKADCGAMVAGSATMTTPPAAAGAC